MFTKAEIDAWNIYQVQSKFTCEGATMLEDFCIKCLRKGLSEKDIAFFLGKFYRQCEQVCLENIERAKEYNLPTQIFLS